MKRKFVISLSILIIFAVIMTLLLMNRTPSLARVYVDPQAVEEAVGQNFVVSLSVSDVANLYAWEVKLAYDHTILEFVNTVEGSFLGGNDVTFFTYKVNDTNAFILIDCTLLGNLSGVNGTGTLATIEFHVIQSGSCDLKLYDTKFLDPSEQIIEHSANSSHFSAAS